LTGQHRSLHRLGLNDAKNLATDRIVNGDAAEGNALRFALI